MERTFVETAPVVSSARAIAAGRTKDETTRSRPTVHAPTKSAVVAMRDGAVRAQVSSMLGSLGCSVDSFGNGMDLIDRLADRILAGSRSSRPDLIIAEAILPGCTGVSLLAGLRELGWETPVILLTRSDQNSVRKQAWHNGVTGIFIEPLDLNQLGEFAQLVLDPIVSSAIRQARQNVGSARSRQPLRRAPGAKRGVGAQNWSRSLGH